MKWKKMIIGVVLLSVLGSVAAWAAQSTLYTQETQKRKVVEFSTGDCCNE